MSTQTLPLLLSCSDLSNYIETQSNDTDLCIVDLSSEEEFISGHIPGAVHLPFQAIISGQPPAPGKLPDEQQLQNVFRYLGLTPNTHFVVCDDEGGGWAGRFIWTLDVVGHKHYSYLDGGMIAWKGEGQAVEVGQQQTNRAKDEVPNIHIDRAYIADIDSIMASLENNSSMIWDARSPLEYQGMRGSSARKGHIPGAINAEWTTLMDGNRHYIIRQDAKEYLASLGIDGSKPIVTHCQTHHRSGFTYLVGKILGFDIKAYDGSWAEWGNHPDTPIEV